MGREGEGHCMAGMEACKVGEKRSEERGEKRGRREVKKERRRVRACWSRHRTLGSRYAPGGHTEERCYGNRSQWRAAARHV